MFNDKKSLREELCGLPQVAIILVMVFWATGFGGWLVRYLPEATRDRNPYASQRVEKWCEWGNLLAQKVKKAEQLGPNYGPGEYFADLRDSEIYEIRYEAGNTTIGDFYRLEQLSRENLERRWEEPGFQTLLKEEQDKTEKWREKLREEQRQVIARSEAARAAKLPKLPPTTWYLWIWGVVLWFVTSYVKLAGLAGAFYLCRAFGRDGNIRALVSWRRWLKAVVRWPLEIWDYPHETWREVLAEAELRRTGRDWRKLFRPLSSADRRFVRTIAANRHGFQSWRNQLGQARLPRWSLITAVAVTLLLLPLSLLAVTSTNSETAKEKTCLTASHTVVVSIGATDADPPWTAVSIDAALPDWVEFIEPPAYRNPPRFYEPEGRIRPGPISEISHVPLLVQTLVV